MKARMLAALIMIGMLLIAAAGCSSVEGAQNVAKNTHKNIDVTIDEFTQNQQISKTIEINPGDTLTVTLGSNPTTGFGWTEQAQISDKTILEQTGYQYVDPTAKDGQPVMGAAGNEVWTFKALKAGTSLISMDYSRPWEGGEKAEWTFKLTVTVK